MFRRRPALRVQSVLFGNDFAALERFVRSAQVAADVAVHERRVVRSVTLALGDCSPQPLLDGAAVARLRSLGDCHVDYRFFGSNLGHGGGQNALAADGRSDFILVVNPDGLLAPNTMAALAEGMTDGVGATEARQVPFEHPKAYDTTTGDTPWASGACVLLRGQAFRDVGGFDDASFFLHGDDVDLGWRMRLAGWRIRHVPWATFFHDKRLTSSGIVDTTGEVERYHSHFAALALAHKYGRPDVTNHLRHFCATADDQVLNAVAREWDDRASRGALPRKVAAGETVAQFVNGYYADHRF